MKLKYETKRNPYMTAILVVVSIGCLFVALPKIDLSQTVFGDIRNSEPSVPKINTMTKEQYAEVVAILNQQNLQKQNAEPDPISQTKIPIEQVPNDRIDKVQPNESSSIYQYIDASGMIVMVDNLDKVPEKYRKKMKTIAAGYKQTQTALKIQSNQIWVPIQISYKGQAHSTLLLLDTGATITSISPALARRLGIQLEDTTTGKATLADGNIVQTGHVTVDSVTVGPKTIRNLKIQILPRAGVEETGLLGMDFLSMFPHTVEVSSRTIRWQ